ncbi:MAG: hypothetical protein M0T80_15495 [Actinomycetota bacterium]|nr:hypothetical protein [Actinomycetota bacterium]
MSDETIFGHSLLAAVSLGGASPTPLRHHPVPLRAKSGILHHTQGVTPQTASRGALSTL